MSDVYLSRGNSKVKCNIFSLPSGVTCRHDVQCKDYCYAKKAERCYKQVLPRRLGNLKASKQINFSDMVYKELANRKNPVTRIHESGDFYSVKYIKKWFDICNRHVSMKFYAYTKRYDIITTELLKYKPDNLTLIFSIDSLRHIENDSLLSKDIELEIAVKLHEGYDKVAVVNDGEYTNCPGTSGGDVKCIKDCRLCIDDETKVIVFKKH